MEDRRYEDILRCEHGFFLHYSGVVGENRQEIKGKVYRISSNAGWRDVKMMGSVELDPGRGSWDCFVIVGVCDEYGGVFKDVPESVDDVRRLVEFEGKFEWVQVTIVPLKDHLASYKGMKSELEWPGGKVNRDRDCFVTVKPGNFLLLVKESLGLEKQLQTVDSQGGEFVKLDNIPNAWW